MTANTRDGSNVTHLHPISQSASKSDKSPNDVSGETNSSTKKIPPSVTPMRVMKNGDAFAFPSRFEDQNLEKIAKRLCEHMNLNYNLCCQLEHIADSLPDNVDKQECLYVARSVVPMVKLAHEFEENVLFPLLRERCDRRDQIDKTLDRLQGEHWEDESYASEIHHGLISYASGLSEVSVESLSYMLRGFFEGMRRHLAFEREHVLPLLHGLDTPA